MTDSGFVNLDRVQIILSELGLVEDQIFKKRQQDEIEFRYEMKMTSNNDLLNWILVLAS